MNTFAVIAYILSFVLLGTYLGIKYSKRKYLFSAFNIGIFTYAFSFLIVPVFYRSDRSWYALGVRRASDYWETMNECVIINAIGFSIMILSCLMHEFNGDYRMVSYTQREGKKINDFAISLFFWGVIIAWYAIVLVFNKGLPIFNSGRTFYLDSAVSPIYNALNELVLIYSCYYGIKTIFHQGLEVKWIIGMCTLLFSGNRGTLLLSCCAPILIIYLYWRTNKKQRIIRKKVNTKKAFVQIAILLVAIGFFGLALQSIRHQQNLNIFTSLNEIIYGNTFSDFRDGGFILKGFNEKYGGRPLCGKTYLAGIISFIPSRISDYRIKWSWGRFSTYALFGWPNHTGLRGGNSMEAFCNFGIIGVIIFGWIEGWFIAFGEKFFYKVFIKRDTKAKGNEYLVLRVISSFSSIFVCSAGAFNIYVNVLFVGAVIILSRFLDYKRKRKAFMIFNKKIIL